MKQKTQEGKKPLGWALKDPEVRKKAQAARRAKLTLRQEKFAAEYIANGGNGVQAALKAYPGRSYNTAAQLASANIRNALIQEKIRGYGEEALETIKDLQRNATSEAVRFQAGKDLVDRSGIAPIVKRVQTQSLNLSLTAEDSQELERIKQLLKGGSI